MPLGPPASCRLSCLTGEPLGVGAPPTPAPTPAPFPYTPLNLHLSLIHTPATSHQYTQTLRPPPTPSTCLPTPPLKMHISLAPHPTFVSASTCTSILTPASPCLSHSCIFHPLPCLPIPSSSISDSVCLHLFTPDPHPDRLTDCITSMAHASKLNSFTTLPKNPSYKTNSCTFLCTIVKAPHSITSSLNDPASSLLFSCFL